MPVQHKWTRAARRTVLALTTLSFVAGTAVAQKTGPFGRIAGQWSGSGTIEFSDGSREPIKCKATYDVLDDRRNLQLSIRCASDSYNFELQGSATSTGGSITGVWSEVTRNVAGTLSGRADEGRLQAVAESPAFSANLTLVTHGDRQTVGIRSRDAQSTLKGASITMQRG
jgi:hypothetical protein